MHLLVWLLTNLKISFVNRSRCSQRYLQDDFSSNISFIESALLLCAILFLFDGVTDVRLKGVLGLGVVDAGVVDRDVSDNRSSLSSTSEDDKYSKTSAIHLTSELCVSVTCSGGSTIVHAHTSTYTHTHT